MPRYGAFRWLHAQLSGKAHTLDLRKKGVATETSVDQHCPPYAVTALPSLLAQMMSDIAAFPLTAQRVLVDLLNEPDRLQADWAQVWT